MFDGNDAVTASQGDNGDILMVGDNPDSQQILVPVDVKIQEPPPVANEVNSSPGDEAIIEPNVAEPAPAVEGGEAESQVEFSPVSVDDLPTENLPFSFALMHIKAGKKVARAGWNGEGLFAFFSWWQHF